MINATNLTLSDQQISGIIGLGFPRLSVLAHTLLVQSDLTSISGSNITSSASATSTSQPASSTSSSAYLPPLLESLFTTPQIPYPVFGLALSPSPMNASATSTSSEAPDPSSTSRYQTTVGSLTLGGVSSLYVSNNSSSGRTVSDIEWWDVVPFGAPRLELNLTASSNASMVTKDTNISALGNASASLAISNVMFRAVPANSSTSSDPSSAEDLSEEQYLYWALDLKNVSMNGTDVGLSSTYASLGLGSIAILDAGSSGMYGPQQDVEKIFSMIIDARQVTTGQWAVPCTTAMTMGFSFG